MYNVYYSFIKQRSKIQNYHLRTFNLKLLIKSFNKRSFRLELVSRMRRGSKDRPRITITRVPTVDQSDMDFISPTNGETLLHSNAESKTETSRDSVQRKKYFVFKPDLVLGEVDTELMNDGLVQAGGQGAEGEITDNGGDVHLVEDRYSSHQLKENLQLIAELSETQKVGILNKESSRMGSIEESPKKRIGNSANVSAPIKDDVLYRTNKSQDSTVYRGGDELKRTTVTPPDCNDIKIEISFESK